MMKTMKSTESSQTKVKKKAGQLNDKSAQSKLYHDTHRLLKVYRDNALSLSESLDGHKYDFEEEFGMV